MATRLGRAVRNAAVLLVLGGGAAAWLYVQEVRPREALHEAAENEKRLFLFGRDDVASGRLRTKSATIAFERDARDPSRFRLTAPVNWPSDGEAITALLDRMVTVKVDPVLTDAATPRELADWGLAPPRMQLDVQLKDGTARSFLVGSKNPLANGYPVTDEKTARVGLSDPAFYWAFDRPTDDFRSSRLIELNPKSVRRLRLRQEDDPAIVLEKSAPDGGWQVGREGEAPRAANARKAELLVIAFTRRLEATSFVTDQLTETEAPRLGLEPARGQVELETFDGQTLAVRFGRRADTSAEVGAWVAHPTSTRTVAEISDAIEKDIETPVEALVDRTLSSFDPEDIQRVRMQLGSEAPFVLVRTGKAWTIEGQPALEPKSWRVDAIIRAFALMGGDATHAETPTRAQLSEWLIVPASRRLAFMDGKGKVLADVRIGNRLDENHLLARAEGDPRVFTVEESKLRTLPGKLSDLTDGS